MLFLIIHEEFHLETEHLFKEKDIRHMSYRKMLPTKRLNLHNQGNKNSTSKSITFYLKLLYRSRWING